MPEPFTHRLRVRYNECDPQGIVFNANYLTYFDIALTELWREACGGYLQLMQEGLDLVVAEANVSYRAVARFDDVLDIQVKVARLGETSITSAFRILRGADLITEGELRHVVVDVSSGEKRPIPEWVREGLQGATVVA